MVNAIQQAPKQGEIIWLDFDPQSGHEQAGRRPALVLSHTTYNQKIGRAFVCPITSKVKATLLKWLLKRHQLKELFYRTTLKILIGSLEIQS